MSERFVNGFYAVAGVGTLVFLYFALTNA